MPRVVLIGLAGPTCCGKTTLAKHLRQIIPGSVILHQDDFAPPSELVPMHPTLNLQDWDDAPGAILWEKQRKTLHHLRSTGSLPPEHSSHDHLNEQIPVPIPAQVNDEWRAKFEALQREMGEDDILYVICDGFLMMYDAESVREFDVRIFVREEYAVLKRRREERHGYHTAEGSLWQDPPGYWDDIVWPAYLSAHRAQFLAGDVENGQPDPTAIEGLVLLEAGQLGMEEMVRKACEVIYERVRSGKTAKDWTKP
ncbi:hypothetical protein RQP46_000852 [Phenoliferia psychrophenolica]